MDHKPWIWRKKSSEKAIASGDKVNSPPKGNEEEIKTILTEKARLEKNLKIVNDKLSSALSECDTKDELVKKNTSIAQEAIAGWEKSEAEAAALKQELDEAIAQRDAGEDRIAHLDSALEECMQQLHFVREEQEQRIHDAVLKTSSEFEKIRTDLAEKLTETDKRLSKMGVESTQLSKALLAKEKIIEDLHKQLTELDANFNSLLSRLKSTEKDNASLKYEVRVLEKEVEIRNEEREFIRRTAESSHKQHLDSVKRVAKLESECQKLRLLVRKRLPGPAALAKMKNEVEILGRDSSELKRRQSTSMSFAGVSAMDHSPETPTKRISVLTEKMSILEEQNRFLKEALDKKTNEPQFSQIMHTQTTSKSSQVQSLLEEPSNYQSIIGREPISYAESCASSLITDLEHFRNGKEKCLSSCRTVGGSLDLTLMDDFAEMEKLAIVSVNAPDGNSQTSSNKDKSNGLSPKPTIGKTIKPDKESDFRTENGDFGSKSSSIAEFPCLELTEKNNHHVPSDLKESLCKLIDLIEGISFPSSEKMIRVFWWKTSELSVVLKKFLCNCQQMLNGKTSFGDFVDGQTIALDWILNHCFSHQDVSSIKDSIQKHFDCEEPRSESEVEKLFNPEEKLSCLSEATITINPEAQTEEEQPSMNEQNNKPKEELVAMECEKKNLEGRPQSAMERNDCLMNNLRESKEVEDESENQNQYLGNQLRAVKILLNEARQVEHDSKHPGQTTYLESSLLLESMTERQNTKNDPKSDSFEEDKHFRTDLEITAASEKLAQCQETILNLGKQLKALAPPKDAALLDKVASPPSATLPITTNDKAANVTPQDDDSSSLRSSLLDRMAEDDVGAEYKFPKSTEVDSNYTAVLSPNQTIEPHDKFILVNGLENQVENGRVGSWAIVPTKKQRRGSLWRKLLWRKKKAKSLKLPLPFTL